MTPTTEMLRTIPAILAGVFATGRDDVAIVCGAETLRYGELDTLTAGTAAALVAHGVPPRATVGLVVERGLTQVACVVALVRAGRAFCFLDRRTAPAWNRDVIRRAGVTHIVGRPDPGLGPDVRWIAPDNLLGAPAGARVDADGDVAPDDLVYVNFSSGTTGAPKMIPCTHRGVVHVCHAPAWLPGPPARMVYSAPLTFDASQLELWTALLNGGCVIVNPAPQLTCEGLRRLIAQGGADTLWLTTSLFKALVDVDPACVAGIRHLITGGEAMSPRHVAAVYGADPAITVHNVYGPTETTIITTAYPVPRDLALDRPVPLGAALPGAGMFVVDEHGAPGPDGAAGELVITGPGLSPGYLGDPALNERRFAPLVIGGAPVRAYWTGDRASRDADGVFHFHGRDDDQVKVRGQRVTLSEIGDAYAAHPGVLACAVVARPGATGTQLGLCVVPRGAPPSSGDLIAFGEARLPPFMVPRDVLIVDALPLTTSGKLDRKQLVARLAARAAAPGDPIGDATGDEPEAEHGAGTGGGEMVACLRRLAGLPGWRLGASFFEAGGDSLGAIMLVSRLQRLVGDGALDLETLYRSPTLATIAAAMPAELVRRGLAPDDRATALPAPLAPPQRSMAYPELLHGDRTFNNVVYLFAAPVAVPATTELRALYARLVAHFPLLGCVVVEGDDGLVFTPGGQPVRGVDPELTAHADAAACAAYHLTRPISLVEGPLLTMFRTSIAGHVHLGVCLHHIVGDHLAQTAILRAIVAATRGEPPAVAPERGFASAARRLVARADRDFETCAAFWEAQAIVPPDVAAQPVSAALVPTVRRRRIDGIRADRAPSELLLGWLAAAAAALETVFDIREPVVLCLVSLREDAGSLGFQTVAAPIALTGARVAGGRPRPALLDAVLAARRHAVIGIEEILLAAGLDRARLPFLVNVVDLAADDERWWRDHLLDTPTEGCKSELDLTILRAGDHLELTVTTRFAASLAEALLDALVAGRPAP